MAKTTADPRELHVQAPELVPQLDLIAKYLGESRSMASRDILRRGLDTWLEAHGFATIEELAHHLTKT